METWQTLLKIQNKRCLRPLYQLNVSQTIILQNELEYTLITVGGEPVHFNVISLFLWICWNAIFARTCNIFSAHLAYIILSKWRNDEKPTTNKRRADDDRTEKKLDCSCALQTKVQRQIIRQRFMFTPEHKEICWLISKWKKKAIDKNADFSNWKKQSKTPKGTA